VAHAQKNTIPIGLYVGAGAIANNMNKITASSTGERKRIGSYYYDLHLLVRFGAEWAVAPSFIYTPIHKKATDGTGTKTSILAINVPLVRQVLGFFDFKLGPGLFFYFINGPGGRTDVSSGYDSTRDYAVPSRTSVAKNISANAGIGVNIYSVRLDIDAVVLNVGSKLSRTFNYMAQLSYGFF